MNLLSVLKFIKFRWTSDILKHFMYTDSVTHEIEGDILLGFKIETQCDLAIVKMRPHGI